MVFKKYKKKNGKVFGPYFYMNVRKGDRVKTIYLGSSEREALKREKGIKSMNRPPEPESPLNRRNLFAIGISLVLALFIFANFTGFFVYPEEYDFMPESLRTSRIVVGEPVKWVKRLRASTVMPVFLSEISDKASNITVKRISEGGEQYILRTRIRIIDKGIEKSLDEYETGKAGVISPISIITGRITGTTGDSPEIIIEENIQPGDEIEIEYYTPGPEKREEEISHNIKRITISAPDELGYRDVLAYTELPMEAEEERIHLYHLVDGSRQEVEIDKYDTNNNNLIDYVEWIVPHLSNQTYELIIEISKAEHLNENRNFISDIYNEVYQLDDIWSEPIYHNEYVRITFEKALNNTKDITIYARNTQSLNTTIEVYYFNSPEKITEFPIITEEKYYKVLLTEMLGSHDTFDLKIVNLDNLTDAYLEFDHIIDPVEVDRFYEPCDNLNAWTYEGGWIASSVSSYWCYNKDTNGLEEAMTLTAPIDLSDSNITYANLSFDYDNNGLDSGEYLKIMANSSVSGWTQVFYTESSAVLDTSVNLSAYITLDAGVHIRGICKCEGTPEYCRWDNINITTYETAPPPANYPQWYENETNASYTDEYNASWFQFNVSWSDADGDIDDVWIEHNFSGTLSNYTITGQNSSAEWFYNDTMGAADYQWRMYANDSGNLLNSTDTWIFTLAKNTTANITLYLNGSTANLNMDQNEYINTTAYLLAPSTAGLTIAIYTNYSDGTFKLWDSGNSPLENNTQLTQNGDFNFTANFSNANYSYVYKDWIVSVVDGINPNVSLISPANDSTWTTSQTVDFNCTAYDNYNLSNISIYGNFSGSWALNSTNSSVSGLSNDTIFSLWLANDDYLWSCEASDNAGNEYLNSTNYTVTVNYVPSQTPDWYSNTTNVSSGAEYNASWFQFNVSWSDADGDIDDVWVEHNFSGTLTNYTITNQNSSAEWFYNDTMGAGDWQWKMYANDSGNRMNSTDLWIFTIAQNTTVTATLALSPGSPVEYGTGVTATCVESNPQVTGILWRNDTDKTSVEGGTAITLGVGVWDYVCNVSGNENYTSASDDSQYTVTKNSTATITLYLNGSSANLNMNQNQYINTTADLLTPNQAWAVEIWTNYSDGTFKLWDSGNSPLENNTQLTQNGDFNFTANFSNANYSYVYDDEIAIVAYVDTVNPDSVGFIDLTPANDTNQSTDNYYINVSFNDSFPDWCELELTNASSTINYTMTQGANSSEYYFNVAGQSDYNTYFYAYCNDTSGNWGISTARHITIDTTAPSNITYTSPSNNYNSSSNTVEFNFTTWDNLENSMGCTLYINDSPNSTLIGVSNNSLSNQAGWTLEFPDGTWVWNITCNDSAGNTNTSAGNYTLTVDTTTPSNITYITANNTNTSNANIQIEFMAWDNLEESMGCTIYLNDSANDTLVGVSNNTVTSFTPGLPDGQYTWNITCNDSAGNTNISAGNYTLTVDTTNPSITLNSPSNSTYQNTGATIDLSVSDSYLDTVIYSNDSYTINFTLSSPYDISTTGWDEQETMVDVWANDSAGNMLEKQYNFTFDDTSPTIVFNTSTAADNANLSTNNIFVNVSSTDANSISTFIDFDNSLVSWWRMDDLNSSGDGVTDYMDRNNGSKTDNGTTDGQVDNGYFGKGWEFDGDGDYINIDYNSLRTVFNSSNWTVTGWFKSNNVTAQQIIEGWGKNLYSGYVNHVVVVKSSRLILQTNNGTDYTDALLSQSTSTLNNNQWYFFGASYNGTYQFLFLDGVEVDSDAQNYTLIQPTSTKVLIGKGQHGAISYSYFNGTIDDVMIFNRTLSAEEIVHLYANQSSHYLEQTFTNQAEGVHTFQAYTQDIAGNVNNTAQRTVTIDTVNPDSVGFLSLTPDNDTNQSTNNYYVNVSFNDTRPESCLLELTNTSGKINYTMNLGANQSEWYINTIHTDYSTYFYAYCNDTANNWKISTARHVRIDTTAPSNITYITANNTNTSNADVQIQFMAWDNLENSMGCTIYLNDSANDTLVGVSNNTVTSFTPGLPDGQYTWNITCNDSTGNENITAGNYTLTVDTTNPSITLNSPSNASYRNTGVTIDLSLTESYPDSVIYSTNGYSGNTTLTTPYNIDTTGWSEGETMVDVWANDSAGNMVEKRYNFTFDDTDPTITFVHPANGSYKKSGGTVLASIYDANLATTIWSNDSWTTNSTTFNISTTGWGEGEFYVQVWASDSVNNMIVNTFNITLDDTIPDNTGFLNPTPNNDTNLTQDNYYVNVSFNDTNPENCLLELTNTSGTINYTMTMGANSSEWYINTSHSNNQTYFYAYCNDTAGNWDNSEIRFVNINAITNTTPIISLYNVSGSTADSTPGIDFNYTDDDLVAKCYLLFNGTAYDLNGSTENATQTTLTANDTLSDDDYEVNISCSDGLYSNVSGSIILTIDATQPDISFIAPTENNDTNLSQDYYLVNVSISEAASAVLLELANSSGTINYTMTQTTSTNFWFNVTGQSDNKTYFYVYANDTLGNLNRSLARFIMTDTTPPEGEFIPPTPANGTNLNQDNYFVNITFSEAISLAFLEFTNSSGTANYTMSQENATTYYFNITGQSDNKTYFYVYANDSIGNIGRIPARHITVDTTAPTVSLSCSPSSVFVGQTVTCSCTATDVMSGIADISRSSPGTSTAGQKTVTCTATDNAGNSNSASFSYLVTSPGGGGPVSGGPASSPVTVTKVWTEIASGGTMKMAVDIADLDLTEINIQVKNRARNINIDIERLEDQPVAITKNITGKVYQYVEITPTNIEETNINRTNIGFRVNKTWISNNSINKSRVYLNRYKDYEWNRLTTTREDADADYEHYEAETPGFSVFAISGEEIEEEPVCLPGTKRCEGDELQYCAYDGSLWISIDNCTWGCNESIMECNPELKPEEPSPPEEPERWKIYEDLRGLFQYLMDIVYVLI